MNEYIRKEIKKIFPDNPLIEIPSNHILFQVPFNFPGGLPKFTSMIIKTTSFGIFIEGRIVLLYTYETDLGDGWEDTEVHNNPQSVREKAFENGS